MTTGQPVTVSDTPLFSAGLGRQVRRLCGLLSACAVLTGAVHAGQLGPEGTPRTVEPSVAVFPFVNLSGAPEERWIGRGIAATLTSDLQSIAAVMAADRGAPDGGADEGAALRAVRELGAAWLIDGSYQRLGADLRVIARLLDVDTGAVVHTVKVDGPLEDLFGLQDRVVAELADAILAHQHPLRLAASGETASGAPIATPPPSAAAEPTAPVPATASPSSSSSASSAPATASTASAASAPATAAGFALPVELIGAPPPPVPPAVVSRDAAGHATVRAVRLTAPLRVDGILDERVYDEVQSFSDFVQREPLQGAPATEKTEAWVFFDDENFYVSARCWDSAPESQWIVNEMRRDSNNISNNEAIFVFLDPFYDRRNGHMLIVNAIGGKQDAQTTDERTYDGDWNPIWEARTGRFEGGWTLEFAVPFKSLRYRPGRTQTWGFEHSPQDSMEERAGGAHTARPGARAACHLPGVAGRDAGRARGAPRRGRPYPGAQAVRDLGGGGDAGCVGPLQ